MTRQERVNAVAAAVADGRITPSRRAFWLSQLRDNPSAHLQLAALAPDIPDWFN